MKKIILDLCGGTGSWSKPYKDAGYDVRVITWPEYDVRTYKPPANVYGILAAPPCTMFSIARRTAKTPPDFKGAMEVVKALFIKPEHDIDKEWQKPQTPDWLKDKKLNRTEIRAITPQGFAQAFMRANP